MAEPSDLTLLRNCDYVVRMRLRQPPDLTLDTPADWTMVLEVRQTAGGATVTTSHGSFALVPHAETLGVWDFMLTAQQTANLTRNTYVYAIHRTNSGYSTVFTKGQLLMESF
jgi:hypothetical protein